MFEIILNLDQLFRRRDNLKIFLIYSSGAFMFSASKPFVQYYGSGPYAEHFCETVLNLEQWFKRKCCLKTFLIENSGSPFVQ